MQLEIDDLIFGYLFVCTLLIAFNIVYIFYSAWNRKHIEKETVKWMNILEPLIQDIDKSILDREHLKLIKKKTRNTDGLLAYSKALERIHCDEDKKKKYYEKCTGIYQSIISDYSKKDSMDRAFAAYFISKHTPVFGDEYHYLYDLILSYLDDSSVYCRENVLKALYACGNVQAVYNMLIRMEEHSIFHHKKLITDGLITFKGDKKALADMLWSHYEAFGENMQIAIINFITATQDGYGETFMKALQNKHQSIEIKLSFIRYYRKHYYEPILPLLYDYINNDLDDSISIVVASVLTKYPSEETREVLRNSIHHRNWYVRLNSATSLVDMSISDEDVEAIVNSGDIYAMEMLRYVLEENNGEAGNDA